MSNLVTVRNNILTIINDLSITNEKVFFAKIFKALSGLTTTANGVKAISDDCARHYICNFEGCTKAPPANTIANGEGGKYYSLYEICTAANNTTIDISTGDDIGLNILNGRNLNGISTFVLELVKNGSNSQSLGLILNFGNTLIDTSLVNYFERPIESRTRPTNACKE